MELNTRGRYAVMAMADLAKYGPECAPGRGARQAPQFGGADDTRRAMSLSEIAVRQNLPVAYLEQLFAKLRAAGLVASVRGRGGGYRLARPAAEIAIADVLAAVEESTRMIRCSGASDSGCVGNKRCLTHGLWHALGEQIEGFLARVTLQDVVEDTIVAGERL